VEFTVPCKRPICLSKQSQGQCYNEDGAIKRLRREEPTSKKAALTASP
jgi:hypothetical protein